MDTTAPVRPASAPDLSAAPPPVVVVGAGPVGLAAAAHLTAHGLPFLVLEAGADVGAAVRGWGHVRMFTPWHHVVDGTAEELLAATGWSRPATSAPPTGDELVTHYLEPLARLLGDRIHLGHRVLAVTRDSRGDARTDGPEPPVFLLRVRDRDGIHELPARAVIDASGTWGRANPLGATGRPATGEEDVAEVLTGPLPDVLGRDRARFSGRTTLVVGSGHSAAGTLLALARLADDVPGTRAVWAVRSTEPARAYGDGEADALPARGALGSSLRRLVGSGVVDLVTGFATTDVVRVGDTASVVGDTPAGTRRIEGVHTVVPATGFRPDLTMLEGLRLDLDPALECPRSLGPLVDPAVHSCGTVPPHGHRELAHPEPGLYVVGAKSYGRAPTFLLATGNEQVRSVVAALAGDTAAADEVRLVLPETGVCSTDGGQGRPRTVACCGAA